MSLFKKHVITTVVLFLIASCSGKSPTKLQQLSALETNLKNRAEYNTYLALEYLTFSRNLVSVEEIENSEHFAQKGLKISRGIFIRPENPLVWKADPLQIEEMVLMQKRLETVLNSRNIKFYLPIQTAHLTFLYDCWIARESKAVFRSEKLAQCHTRFSRLLGELEDYIDDLKKDKQPIVKIKEPEFTRHDIKFDLNSFKFNNKADKDILAVLEFLETLGGNYRILIIGNTDRTGDKIYNQNLAFKRASLTKTYLISNGVNKDLIELHSLGESFPDIITKDGTQQQRNRLVSIYVLKGFGSFSSYPLPLVENKVYYEEIKKARTKRGLAN